VGVAKVQTRGPPPLIPPHKGEGNCSATLFLYAGDICAGSGEPAIFGVTFTVFLNTIGC
jgi:hypothetical protein